MTRQSLKARKALRSAAALRGWETRRSRDSGAVVIAPPVLGLWTRFRTAVRRLFGMPTW